jgi:hypothetical protein
MVKNKGKKRTFSNSGQRSNRLRWIHPDPETPAKMAFLFNLSFSIIVYL